MNERQKAALRAEKEASQAWNRKLIWLTIMLLICGVIGTLWSLGVFNSQTSNQVKRHQTVHLTEEQATAFINELLAAVDPKLSSNSHFPPDLKKRMQWIYDQHSLGKLRFTAIGQNQIRPDGKINEGTLMSTNYVEGMPEIYIYLPRAWTFMRVQYGYQGKVGQKGIDTFAITLAHEAIHLENDRAFFEGEYSIAKFLEEERRAWAKTIFEIARPMRASGGFVEIDFCQADDVLASCNDDAHCPEFIAFIARQNGQNPE